MIVLVLAFMFAYFLPGHGVQSTHANGSCAIIYNVAPSMSQKTATSGIRLAEANRISIASGFESETNVL